MFWIESLDEPQSQQQFWLEHPLKGQLFASVAGPEKGVSLATEPSPGTGISVASLPADASHLPLEGLCALDLSIHPTSRCTLAASAGCSAGRLQLRDQFWPPVPRDTQRLIPESSLTIRPDSLVWSVRLHIGWPTCFNGRHESARMLCVLRAMQNSTDVLPPKSVARGVLVTDVPLPDALQGYAKVGVGRRHKGLVRRLVYGEGP
jgi:hypothetical protein